jgi:hypothetical protein
MGKVKGFNDYEIRGNITSIFLVKRDGSIMETLIDTENLEKIKSLNLHWHLRYAPNTNSYYAKACINFIDENNKRCQTNAYLHKYILTLIFQKVNMLTILVTIHWIIEKKI